MQQSWLYSSLLTSTHAIRSNTGDGGWDFSRAHLAELALLKQCVVRLRVALNALARGLPRHVQRSIAQATHLALKMCSAPKPPVEEM
jgi:hypothetical protein